MGEEEEEENEDGSNKDKDERHEKVLEFGVEAAGVEMVAESCKVVEEDADMEVKGFEMWDEDFPSSKPSTDKRLLSLHS